jgi:hypothetical protein
VASALIPGCVGLAGSAARAADSNPINPQASTPTAVLMYRDFMIHLQEAESRNTSISC